MAIEVDDMDRAIEYLKRKRVEISWGPVTPGTSKRAEIIDPDGLSIESRERSSNSFVDKVQKGRGHATFFLLGKKLAISNAEYESKGE